MRLPAAARHAVRAGVLCRVRWRMAGRATGMDPRSDSAADLSGAVAAGSATGLRAAVAVGATSMRRSSTPSTATSCRCWPTTAWPACRRSRSSKTRSSIASGEQQATFRLEHNALRPLVDVGRVFGLAAGQRWAGRRSSASTTARPLLPEHEAVFREAADTLRIVLWQQGRVGITPGHDRLRACRRRCSAARPSGAQERLSLHPASCWSLRPIRCGWISCERAGVPRRYRALLRADVDR